MTIDGKMVVHTPDVEMSVLLWRIPENGDVDAVSKPFSEIVGTARMRPVGFPRLTLPDAYGKQKANR